MTTQAHLKADPHRSLGVFGAPQPVVAVGSTRPRPMGTAQSAVLAAVSCLSDTADTSTCIHRALDTLRRNTGARGLEWWAPGRELDHPTVAVGNTSFGPRECVLLETAGRAVIVGSPDASDLIWGLSQIAPLIRWRLADDELVRLTASVLRENAALDDFASVVAHELKTQLHLAQTDVGTATLAPAVELVGRLLEDARCRTSGREDCESAEELSHALNELGRPPVTVDSLLPERLPLPATLLRMLLRNAIGNAVSAGAQRVRLDTSRTDGGFSIRIRDDGVGPGDASYRSGSGLGLRLCRRALERRGGTVELRPRPAGGAVVTITLPGGERQ